MDPVDSLVLDLCDYLAGGPRAYAEVMDAWKTSCPRLPVWEEANFRGFVRCRPDQRVELTPAGHAHLRRHRNVGRPSPREAT
jgi:D-3-phosphoglycerate dehydrogenase / 2-oxoglutarate reductase